MKDFISKLDTTFPACVELCEGKRRDEAAAAAAPVWNGMVWHG